MVQQRAGEKKKQLIIDVCKKLFYQKGYSSTTYEDICRAADIPPGTIAYHFDGKRGIAAAIDAEYERQNKIYIEKICGDRYSKTDLMVIENFHMWKRIFEDEHLRRFLLDLSADKLPNASSIDAVRYFYECVMDDQSIKGIDDRELELISAAQIGMSDGLLNALAHSDYEYTYEYMAEFGIRFFMRQIGMSNEIIERYIKRGKRLFDQLPIDNRYYRDFAYDDRYVTPLPGTHEDAAEKGSAVPGRMMGADVTSAAEVLVVEDDAAINDVVASRLRRDGIVVTSAFSGTEAQMLLEQRAFDVVVCDLMLPGAPGEDIVALVRRRHGTLPIIVISAKAAPSDKVELLGLGADDYLAKPFDLDELAARVQVQLRHGAQRTVADATLRRGRWELDAQARTLSVDGRAVPLTRTEFNIAEMLAENPRRVFTKQELFERAWGEPYIAQESTVAAHVSNLRAKLKPTGTDAYVQTVWGIGFRLAPDVDANGA